MTIEEAKNSLIDIFADLCAYYCNGYVLQYPNCDFCRERETIMAAVDAIEKQIPMKPEKEPIQMHVCGTELTYDLERYKCGACDAFLLYSDEEPLKTDRYCINCGQAIDWSEMTVDDD